MAKKTKNPIPFELQKDKNYKPGDVLQAVPVDPNYDSYMYENGKIVSGNSPDICDEDEWHCCETAFDVEYSVNLMLKEHGLQLVRIPRRISKRDQEFIRIVPLSMKPKRGKVFDLFADASEM